MIRSGVKAMDVGFSRMDQPGYILRLVPGPKPVATALTEVYLPPDEGYGSRGIDLDLNGVVWTSLSSDISQASTVANATGRSTGRPPQPESKCPEGWTLYQYPGPQFKGVTEPGSAEHAYYVWVDRYNTLGLGPNVPIAMTNGGEALMALVNGNSSASAFHILWGSSARMSMDALTIRTPDGKGKDCGQRWEHAPCSTTKAARVRGRKFYKVQVRPDPLAR